MKTYYLGVDVGGTKCHALISDETGQAAGFGEAGPGNHEAVGYPGLIAALQEVTGKALTSAGLVMDQIAGAGFGVAGYDWPSERQPTLDAIATLGLTCPVEAVNDTIIGLLAGSEQGWGVAVVAGTGCNCWGWDQQHRIGRVTGCGGFGEHGGAGDLVHSAINAVAYEWSRRGPSTQLSQAFTQLVGAKDLPDLLEGLTMGKYYIGSHAAPLVFQVAAAGDPVAREVIRWNGSELGELANAVIRQLNFESSSFEVVLVGSLYEGGSLLIDPMRETIHSIAPAARLVRLNAPPVVGGTLLGMDQGGLNAPQFRAALVESTRKLIHSVQNLIV
ncbi:MAG: N-acetylglucosamine kinase [Omnitrophica WOR_2 bacterium]